MKKENNAMMRKNIKGLAEPMMKPVITEHILSANLTFWWCFTHKSQITTCKTNDEITGSLFTNFSK